MSLNVAEIQSLLRRAHMSARRGYQIALGEEYAQKLGGTDGSPVGLIELCVQTLAGNGEPVAPPADDDDGPTTWVPPAPMAPTAPSVAEEPVELTVEVSVEPAQEPAVEEVPVAEPDLPVDVTADVAVEESADEGTDADEEPEAEEAEGAEAEEPAETEATDVAKSPAPKRGRGRRGK